MNILETIIQLIIGLGLLNVWLLRFNKKTEFRGGEARNMKEEFNSYGLPNWFLYLIGFLKISIAIVMLVGIWVENLVVPAAIILSVLMLGAILMHLKVNDPIKKSLPAAALLILALLLIVI